MQVRISVTERMQTLWMHSIQQNAVLTFNPFKPEFTIVIFTHSKSQIAVAISTCSGWKCLEVGDKWKNILLILKQFHENFVLKPPDFRKLGHFSDMRNDALMHPEGLKR